MPFEVTASQKDQTLPMILTLRGDEAIVDEFTYDSDQAMHYLGIKRSRLNQISGRELRVARIRRDRYIRPVYRECDLKDYLEWTRATATHLSSSKAIEQAVENLDDRFDDVLADFNEKLQQVSEEQQVWLRGEFDRLPSRLGSRSVRGSEPETVVSSSPSLIDSEKALRQMLERLARVQSTGSNLQEGLRDLAGLVASFVPEMRELNVAQKTLRFDFDRRFEALVNLVEELHRATRELWSGQSTELRDFIQALEAREVERDERAAKAGEQVAPEPACLPRRRPRPQLANPKRRYGAL